jgi:hypothetical protein
MAKIDSNIKQNAYVYMAFNIESDEFYFGFRCANKVKPEDDIGVKYFSSAKYVSDIKDKFDWIILDEFKNADDAYFKEQQYIHKHWNNPKLLNRSVNINAKQSFKVKKHSDSAKHKMSVAKVGFVPWNKGKKTGPQSLEQRRNSGAPKRGRKYTRQNLEYKSWSLGLTKETNASVKAISDKLKGRPSWMKGVTAATDPRVAALGRKISATTTGRKLPESQVERLRYTSSRKHIIRCTCLWCKVEYDSRNFVKHLKTDCRIKPRRHKILCTCLKCKRTISLRAFRKHITKECVYE